MSCSVVFSCDFHLFFLVAINFVHTLHIHFSFIDYIYFSSLFCSGSFILFYFFYFLSISFHSLFFSDCSFDSSEVLFCFSEYSYFSIFLSFWFSNLFTLFMFRLYFLRSFSVSNYFSFLSFPLMLFFRLTHSFLIFP